ncbi:MAG: dicarboxylate--CoA ligase PimA [Micavibrio sp.]|nr:MAG: dicarboxylate--CoA ligase PimA [Micavibrio sp.]
MSNSTYPWLQVYPDDIDWDMAIPEKPVFDILDETAVKYADRPAFDFLGKKYNWVEISNLANRFASGLQSMGVKKGDKIGLFLPNSPYFLICYYAILKTGATVVNFNPLYAERELSNQIEDSETDIMITTDLDMLYEKMHKMLHGTRLEKLIMCRFTDILPFPKNILFKLVKGKELAKVTETKRISWFHDLIENDGKVTAVDINVAEDIAVLQYTGGTTGVPKGAMLTHKNIYANTVQSLAWFSGVQYGEQKMLGVLPFFHVFAMIAVMNLSVMAALEIIALPRFDLEDTLKIIHKKKPHVFPAVPAIYSAINNSPKTKKYNLSSIAFCISGGAPLPVEVKKTFENMTGCVVVEGYGLTESSPVACVNPINGENIAGSIGLPVPGTIIEIIDVEDKKTPMPIGERGELCIRGPQVMKGYWKKPEETADVLKDGRLYTGDIAIMDERGYVYIVDRLKDMIITNGYNVYPRNVEEAIYLHPNVEECIVAGLPDKRRGEIVKAWIKLKKGRDMTAEDLKEFLGDKISPMEIPKRIEFRDEDLPKTMIGKLSRKDIVEQELNKNA